MNKMRILTLLVAAILFFTIIFMQPLPASAEVQPAAEFKKVCESDSLVMYYSYDSNMFGILDKRNSHIWYSGLLNDDPALEGVKSRKVLSQMQSLAYINVTSFKSVFSYGLNDSTVKVTVETLKNGVRLDTYNDSYKIGIRFEIIIDKDELIISIPESGIIEKDPQFGVAGIEVAQIFGSVKQGEGGFIFYPDGSGAIYNIKNQPSIFSKMMVFDIYGSPEMSFKNVAMNEDYSIKGVMLPVFGVNHGGSKGVFGIVEKGAYNAKLVFSPLGSDTTINRDKIFFRFEYRLPYYDLRLKDSANIQYYTKDRIKGDNTIRYIFLNGSEAEYSGMAAKYRDYLLREGLVKQSCIKGKDMPIVIEAFMGVIRERVLFDKLERTTTYLQAKNMLEKLSANGISNIAAILKGWNKNGYGSKSNDFVLDKRLGGAADFRKLTDYAAQNNIKLFLNTNVTIGKDIRNSKTIIYDYNDMVIRSRDKKRVFIDPVRFFTQFLDSFTKRVSNYNISGLCYEDIGSILSADYSERKPLARSEAKEVYSRYLKASSDSKGFTAVEGGNSYILPYADLVMKIPDSDSGYQITDYGIPFYQMVINGIIPYTSSQGNLSYDYRIQKLKWIENGCIPYYELTQADPYILYKTDYAGLYSSQFDIWLKDIRETYEELNNEFGNYSRDHIIGHQYVNEYVRIVKYNSGKQILINYSEEQQVYGNTRIPAKGYVVQKGDK